MAVPPILSEDGYEIQFATNYLGHAYLTKMLLPILLKTAAEPGADVRIVTLSSVSHSWTPKGGIEFDALKTSMDKQGKVSCYGQSKLACLLYSRELARRYERIKCIAVNPGNVRTGLSRSARESSWWMGALDRVLGVLIGADVKEGAKMQVWAAVGKVDEGDVKSGEYYEPGLVKGDGSKDSRSVELAGRLWEWTEKELEAWKQSGKRVGSD
jgi:retinol dehydrogenase-12